MTNGTESYLALLEGLPRALAPDDRDTARAVCVRLAEWRRVVRLSRIALTPQQRNYVCRLVRVWRQRAEGTDARFVRIGLRRGRERLHA